MSKDFRVSVFGKAGCAKCKALNKRLDTLLASVDWQDFEKHYCDVETEDGLVAFCLAECINPSRIPALVISKRDPETGEFEMLRNSAPGKPDEACKSAKLYTFLGLQTDYGQVGKGLLPPQMLASVLQEARSA